MFNRFLRGVLLAASVFLVLGLTTVAALCTVVLISTGVLTVVVSLGALTGLLGTIASDLSPPAMLFTGLFCVFSAFSIGIAMYICCPKAVKSFGLMARRYFS